MTILTVVGARPQFIKAAAVSRVLSATDGMNELLVHTGQHYDPALSDVFFDELEIPAPSHHLGIGSGSHGAQTGQMLSGIEQVLLETTPDWVLVYGDTNSTLAGALAAAKLHIPIAHVEAGLRSFNRRMPEEINRVLTDHASTLLFTPTETADRHLAAEGIPPARIRRVGDVMFDVARFFSAKAARESTVLKQLGLQPESYVLATVHRAENTDDPDRLQVLFEALGELHAEIPVILPLHPRTRAVLERTHRLDWAAERVRFIEPVGYLDMMQLERKCPAGDDRFRRRPEGSLLRGHALRDAPRRDGMDGTGGSGLEPPRPANERGIGHCTVPSGSRRRTGCGRHALR